MHKLLASRPSESLLGSLGILIVHYVGLNIWKYLPPMPVDGFEPPTL